MDALRGDTAAIEGETSAANHVSSEEESGEKSEVTTRHGSRAKSTRTAKKRKRSPVEDSPQLVALLKAVRTPAEWGSPPPWRIAECRQETSRTTMSGFGGIPQRDLLAEVNSSWANFLGITSNQSNSNTSRPEKQHRHCTYSQTDGRFMEELHVLRHQSVDVHRHPPSVSSVDNLWQAPQIMQRSTCQAQKVSTTSSQPLTFCPLLKPFESVVNDPELGELLATCFHGNSEPTLHPSSQHDLSVMNGQQSGIYSAQWHSAEMSDSDCYSDDSGCVRLSPSPAMFQVQDNLDCGIEPFPSQMLCAPLPPHPAVPSTPSAATISSFLPQPDQGHGLFIGFSRHMKAEDKLSIRSMWKKQVKARPVRVRKLALEKCNKGTIPPSFQLWEFLLHFLELGLCPDAIVWMKRETGLFHIKQPGKLAKEWGKYRDIPSMTYDKMSRAMRYYYAREILDKTSGRMIYKFTDTVMQQVRFISGDPPSTKANFGTKSKRRSKKQCL